jgi:hypothetical protein
MIDTEKEERERIRKIIWFCTTVCLADSCKDCQHRRILKEYRKNETKE